MPGWKDLDAVRSGRVFFADGNAYFNRPGPRLADSAEILAEIFHPGVAAPRHAGSAYIRRS
jgi:iron complex transport system substrate-binding protein